MPAPFNLVAQLQIQGPNNLNQVVRRIQSSLNSVSANVNIALGRNTITNLTNANAQLTAMSTNLARVTADATTAAAAIQRMVSALGAAKTNTTNINITNNLRNISQQAKTASGDMEEFGRVSALAVRRFVAFSIPAGFLVGAVTGFRQLVDAAIDYDKQMNRLEQVTMASKSTIADLSSEITRLSTSMGVSSKTLSEVSVVLASAGYTAKEVKTALETLAQTQLASQFDDIKTSTDGAIAVMQQFKMSASDLGKVFGEITNVSRGFAVESRDIVAAIQHAGGSFRAAGGNLEEFMALFTSVRATTRESAESIATGLRTIFTRIERPRTIEFLRQLGVELQDVNGMFVGPYEAIRRLSEAMKGLDTRDVRYSAVVEELGGYRQVSKVIPLLQEFATAQKALGVAQAGSTALSQEAAISQEALATKLTKVKEEWLKLGREFVESKGFKILAESAMSFATALTQVLRALQPVLPLLATLGSVMAVKAIGSAGAGFMKGLHFARGGVVPGSGNSDTVPAMLQPGEFVMRKQAVQSIGADTLKSMNRYAAGGSVVGGRHAYGNLTDNEMAAMKKLAETSTEDYVNVINFGKIPQQDKRRIRYHRVDPRYVEIMKQNTHAHLAAAVNNSADTIGKSISAEIGRPVPIHHLTAEAAAGLDSINSIRGVVGENIINAFQSKRTKFTGAGGTSGDFLNGLEDVTQHLLAPEHRGRIDVTRPAEIKAIESNISERYVQDKLRTLIKHIFDLDEAGVKHGMTNIPRFSSGGGVDSDTVPALLTPGEFVINKEAVRRIGVENLNRANNVQRFASGGSVGIGTGSVGSIVTTGLASGMVQSFFGAESAVTKFTQTLTELIFTVEGTRAAMGLLQSSIGVQAKPIGGVGFMQPGDLGNLNLVRGSAGRRNDLRNEWMANGTSSTIINQRLARFDRTARGMQNMARLRTGASIGAVAGTALLAGGAEFLASRYDAAADAQEGQFAAGDFSGAGKYTSNKQASNTLSNIGTFAATGAGIGAMFGPIGMAVGGVVGGLVGWGKSLYEADSITKEAAKKINDAKFGYYERTGREAAGRVLSGKSVNELGDIATTNDAIKQQLATIREDTDAKGKADKIASLANQMGTYDEFKSRMIKSSDSLADFKNSNGGLGQTLIDAIAKTQHVGSIFVEQSINKEIEARRASEASLKKAAMMMEDFTETIRSMQHFNILLEGMNEKLELSNQRMAAFSAIAGGQYATVNPVASTVIANAGNEAASVSKDQLDKALSSLFGGAGEYGNQMKSQTMEINQIMRELPGMLRRSLTSGYDIETGLGKQLDAGGFGKSQFAQMIMSQLGASLGAGGASGTGEVDLARKIREDAGKVAKELEGAFGQDWNKAIAEVERNLLEGAKRISEAHRAYAQVQLQATELEVRAAQTAAQHKLETQKMNLMGTGLLPSLTDLQAPFLAGISAQTRQTGAAGSTDVGVIARALDKVNNELSKPAMITARENFSQGIKGPAEDRYRELFVESNRLSTALKKLADSSDLAAAAHDKFVEAFQQKETKGKFLEGYVFGDADTKLRTLYGMKGAQVLAQNPQLERVMPEIMKDSARGFFQQFSNMHLPMFQIGGKGTNAEGKPITGQMMLDEIKAAHFDKFLMSDKDRADMGMPNARTFGDVVRQQASVGTLDVNQQKYLDDYRAANEIQRKAQEALLASHRTEEAKIFHELIDAMKSYTNSQKETFDALRLGAAEKQRDSLAGRATDMSAQITRATALDATVNKAGINFGLAVGSDESINRSARFANIVGGQQDLLAQQRMFGNIPDDLEQKLQDTFLAVGGERTHVGYNRDVPTNSIDDIIKKSRSRLGPQISGALDATPGADDLLRHLANYSYSVQGTGGEDTPGIRAADTKAIVDAMKAENNKRIKSGADSLGITEAQYKQFNTEANVKSVVAGQRGIEPGFNMDKVRTELDKVNHQIAGLASNLKEVDTSKVDKFLSSLSQILGQTATTNIPIIDPRPAAPLGPAGQLRNLPQALAYGGSIWQPQGTDTVPAMLTPGEFVVRREMAQRHKGLLHAINNGALYAADGDEVPTPLEMRRAAGAARYAARRQAGADHLAAMNDRRAAGAERYTARHAAYNQRMAARMAKIRATNAARAMEPVLRARKEDDDFRRMGHTEQEVLNFRLSIQRLRAAAHHEGTINGVPVSQWRAQRDAEHGPSDFEQWRAARDAAPHVESAGMKWVREHRNQPKRAPGIYVNGKLWHKGDAPAVTTPVVNGRPVATAAPNRGGDWFWNMMAENNKRNDADAAMHAQIHKQDMAERQKVFDFHLQETRSRGARRANPLASDAAGTHSVKELREIARLEHRHHLEEPKIETAAEAADRRLRGFQRGGPVDGVPAYLSKGEFVMNSAATSRMGVDNLSRMNRGGFVGHYADGGNVTQNGDAMGSKAVQATLDSAPLKAIFDAATASFKTSSDGVLQASTVFKTAFDSLTETVAKIPSNIEVKVNNISELATQTAQFGSVLTSFNTGLTATASSFNAIVTNLQSVAQTIGGLVGSLKDKLTVDISVTHDVNVKVSGSVMSASDTGAIAQIAKDAVGPMLDQLKNRLSSFGPGLA